MLEYNITELYFFFFANSIEKGVYELNKMAVKKNLRGKGIGHQLLSFSIEFAKKKKYNSVILYSNKVLENSIHLYNKFGFKKIKSEEKAPLIIYPIILAVFARKYSWSNWKEKLFSKVR